MASSPLDDLIAEVETWQTSRRVEAEAFTLRGFRGFAEQMNYRSKRLIGITNKRDPEFWTAVAELATNAATITTRGAKLFADHQDVTNL